MKKVIIILAVITFISIPIFFVLKNIVVKSALIKGLNNLTGLSVSIHKVDVNLSQSFMDIEGLKLKNPAGFHEAIMISIPRIFVNFDLKSYWKGIVHLEKLILEIKELLVEKNEKGKMNVSFLKGLPGPIEEKEKSSSRRNNAFNIDFLEIKIEKVVFKDYSSGAVPTVMEYRVNINEKLSDITDTESLLSLILVRALAKTTIVGLANFDLKPFKEKAGSLMNQGSKLVKGVLNFEDSKELSGSGAQTEDVNPIRKPIPSDEGPFQNNGQ